MLAPDTSEALAQALRTPFGAGPPVMIISGRASLVPFSGASRGAAECIRVFFEAVQRRRLATGNVNRTLGGEV